MIRRRPLAVLTTTAAAALTLAGCSSMTWEQKVEALKHAGERGADAHYVLITKEQEPNKATCTENYTVFMDSGEAPPTENISSSSAEWRDLHLSYFVDSCISGEPRQPATRPKTPTSTPSMTSPAPTTDVDDGDAGDADKQG